MSLCLLLLVTLGWHQCLLTVGTPVSPPLSSQTFPLLPNEEGAISDLPLLVPDVSKVDIQALKDAGAGKFLALWSVYVSGKDVMISDEPWTLLLPLNSGLPKDPSFLTDSEFTRDILLNHVILGELVDLKAASVDPLPYYTLAHSEVVFDSLNGEFLVNDVKIIGDAIQLPNGVIFIIENNLPLDQPEFLELIPEYDTPNSPTPVEEDPFSFIEASQPLSDAAVVEELQDKQNTKLEKTEKLKEESINDSAQRATRFDKFRKKAEKNEESSPPSIHTTKERPTTSTTVKTTTRESTTSTSKPTTIANIFNSFFSAGEKEGKSIIAEPLENEFESSVDSSVDEVFSSSLKNDLKAEYSNGHEFLYHFNEVKLDNIFHKEDNYTAIIPTDDAFYDYYPIDWGFNPFQVDNFTKDVLLNHILPGNVDIHSLQNDTLVETLGGRRILVTKNEGGDRSYLNGELVFPEGEVILPKGRLFFLNKILFVNYDRVNALKDQYPYLETGPLLSFPWPTSPFLSHLYKRLNEMPSTKIFAQLLLNSNIAHLLSSIDQNLNRLSYTAFVPMDSSLQEIFPLGEIENIKGDAVSEFLLFHLFPDYIMQDKLTDGRVLQSLSGSSYPIIKKDSEMMIGNATIIEPQKFLYNLGAIYLINKPLQYTSLGANKTITVKSINEDDIASIVPTALPSTNSAFDDSQDGTDGVPFLSSSDLGTAFKDIFTQSDPEAVYETRTEISFSKQVNNGENLPVPKELLDTVKKISHTN